MQLSRRLLSLAKPHGIGFRRVDGFVDCSSQSYHHRLKWVRDHTGGGDVAVVDGEKADFEKGSPVSEWKANGELMRSLSGLEETVRKGGSAKAHARHNSLRKLFVRDRISRLLDPGTPFIEIGLLAGHDMDYGDIPAAGMVSGIGEVSGRLCMIVGNDATVKGGTIYPIALKKTLRCQEIAAAFRLPVLNLVDSGGAYLPLQSQIFLAGGRTFYNEAVMGADGLPQVAVVAGNCTAGGAYQPTMCDDVVIVDKMGSLFLGGPPLVRAATGEIVSAEELGGATLHCTKSGATDYFAEDEEEALAAARDVMETLGDAVGRPLALSHSRPPLHSPVELDGIAGDPSPGPRLAYQVIARVFDGSELLEFRGRYASSIVCGFAKIGGRLVGVIFGTGLPMDAKSAQKAAQLMQMCEERRHPVVFFQRSIQQPTDDNENLRAFARLISNIACASVPKISVNIGGCVGHDVILQCGAGLQPWLSLSWPNGVSGDDAESAVDAVTAAANVCTDIVCPPSHTRKVLLDVTRLLTPALCQHSAQDSRSVVSRM